MPGLLDPREHDMSSRDAAEYNRRKLRGLLDTINQGAEALAATMPQMAAPMYLGEDGYQGGTSPEQQLGGMMNWVGSNMLGGAALSGVTPGRVNMFAGIGAKTADREALSAAEALEKSGVGMKDIHAQTGWFRAPWDNKWRFEIDDSGAKWAGQGFSEAPARSMLDHPGLFDAYPAEGKLPVSMVGGRTSAYVPDPYEPYIKIAKQGDPVSGASHELQHAIQQREGFAKGGRVQDMAAAGYESPDNAYRRLAGEAEARLVQDRMNLTPAQRREQYPLDSLASMLKREGIDPGDNFSGLIARYGNGPANAIDVWHGSPHKFDRFDMSKIGTGEGAQAYGHGLYFAENPEVAGQYATELSRKITANGSPIMAQGKQVGTTGNPDLDDYLMGYGGDVKSAIEGMLFDLRDIRSGPAGKGNPQIKDAQRDLLALRQLRGKVETGTDGNLYKTSLEWPDPAREAADPLGPGHFLDWDLPLSQQPPTVQDALKAAEKWPDPSDWMGPDSIWPEKIVRDRSMPWEDVSDQMRKAGIPGIRYLDAGSRGVGDGSRNYVIFDDRLARILERNGQPIRGLLDDMPDLSRLPVGAPEFRGASDDALATALESIRARNKAKGLDEDMATGAIRDEIARRNAVADLGLPEGNTAGDRARVMTAPRDFYHATKADFPAFSLRSAGTGATMTKKEPAVFLTDNPAAADEFIAGPWYKNGDDIARYYSEGANVMPLNADLSDVNIWDMGGASYNPEFVSSAIKDAKKDKAPSILFRQMRDPGFNTIGQAPLSNIVAMRDPSRIRSRFAAFDPRRRNEANLLASMAGAGLLAPALADYLSPQSGLLGD